MTREAAAEAHVPTQRKRTDVFGVTFLATIGSWCWRGSRAWSGASWRSWPGWCL